MSEQLQLRRGAAAQVVAFTGAQGELVVDTTNNRLVLQDGSTPGGFPSARLTEVITNARTTVSDSPYSATSTDRTIAYITLTAARTVSLPGATTFPTGTRLLVVDETGNCSALNPIALMANGSDKINGGASAAVNVPYGYVALESNGLNSWTVVDQMAVAATTTVAQGSNGASIQFGLLETLTSLSGASTTASTAIPANCVVMAVGARVVTPVTGSPSFSVGIAGNASQFGSGLSVTAGSTNPGLIGPTAFYASTPLIITAASGAFSGGAVRLSIHTIALTPSTS